MIRKFIIASLVLVLCDGLAHDGQSFAANKDSSSTTTTLAPTIPDSPRGFSCGKSRTGMQILANDGWNYKCQQSGKNYIWVHIDCVFSGITCITLPPNPIAPSIGESFVYPNLGGFIIEFQTSTGDSTRKYVEIATDSRFENIVFTGDHSTLYDPSWRCDVRMCGEIFITNGSPMNAGDKLVGVSSITGTVWARVTISNNQGTSTKTFGLVFPGPQMVAPTTITTSTTTTTIVGQSTSDATKRNIVSFQCKKGNLRKQVSGFNPSCGKGWKKVG